MRPVSINPQNPTAALNEIQVASREYDICDIAKNFSFNAAFTQTLALAVTSPTLANTNAVLASLIQIMQRGGLHRTT